jgi:hypothetical protein
MSTSLEANAAAGLAENRAHTDAGAQQQALPGQGFAERPIGIELERSDVRCVGVVVHDGFT